jgi:GT2 family glycosyltransferase
VIDRIVVVDDASPYPLPPAPPRAEVVRLARNGGPATARNRGIARALQLGARTLLFTDLDCVPAPSWAAELVAVLERGPHVAAGGATVALGRTLLDRYHDFAGTLNGRWVVPARVELLYAPTCNFAVRADALGEVRFDERFPSAAGEDYDFCYRLRRAGTIGFHPAAVVRHDFGYAGTLSGLGRFAAMFERYSAADPLLWEKHPELRTLRSEACAAADVLAPVPPADPAAYRRAALGRVRPRWLAVPLTLLRRVARWAYRRGGRTPQRWRNAPDAGLT